MDRRPGELAEPRHEMGYSLWRNGRLIGHVRVPLPGSEEGMVVGLLHLESEGEPLEPVMQVRLNSLADAPTLHHRIDQMNRTESPIPLRRLSAEESEGIPEEERFELRGDEGEVVETSLLMLNHLDAEVSHEVVSSACAEFGLPGTRWTLVARVAPGMDDDGKRLSTDG